ncbi:MAG: hypothetical protein JWM34_2329 [Ilumatobacteraceae bacterium]|nr:hypothetical protein [Ilumatobacteraceae bacterium]
MDQIDIDNLIQGLKQRVQQRRESGDYPAGLEEQLEAEFKIIMAAVHRDEIDTTELGRRVKAVEAALGSIRASGETGSRVPGGSTLHRVTSRLVGRHTNAVAVTVRHLGVTVAEALHEVHHMIDVQREADERQLSEVLGSLMDRLAVVDHLSASVVQLEARVRELEAAATPDQ